MGAVTRDLLAFAVARSRTETVTLVTLSPSQSVSKDGSYSFFKEEVSALARVVPLTSSEIERAAMAGITLNQGFSVAVSGELTKSPDQVIRANGQLLKVIRYTIEEGSSVFLCDAPALGNDGESYGSGYSSP